MPNVNDENISFLNNYLRNKLKEASGEKHLVYLHYSDSEHTYNEHVKYLLEDLKLFNYKIKTECKHYTDHWDVSNFFPDFLLISLRECL